jgi:hypothetical protein
MGQEHQVLQLVSRHISDQDVRTHITAELLSSANNNNNNGQSQGRRRGGGGGEDADADDVDLAAAMARGAPSSNSNCEALDLTDNDISSEGAKVRFRASSCSAWPISKHDLLPCLALRPHASACSHVRRCSPL